MQDQPVINNAAIAALALLIGPFLGKWGIDAGGTERILGIVASVAGGLVAIWRFVETWRKVTPVTNPKTNDGTPLVPLTPAVPAAVPPA